MAIQMTQAEYDAKYGSSKSTETKGPIQMTQAEYDAKYNKKETPNVLDRTMAGLSTARAKFNKNIVSPIGEAVGSYTPEERKARDKLADKVIKESEDINQQYHDSTTTYDKALLYNKDKQPIGSEDRQGTYQGDPKEIDVKDEKYNIAQTVGEYAPEIAIQFTPAGKLKNVGQGITEGVLEYGRTGDIGKALTSGGLTAVGGKLFEKAMNPITKLVKTKYGKQIDKLTPEHKLVATRALDEIDSVGGTRLDHETRGKLINKLNLNKDSENVSEETITALEKAKKNKYNQQKELYDKANEVGKTTKKADTSDTMSAMKKDRDGRVDAPVDAEQEEIVAKINNFIKQQGVSPEGKINSSLQANKAGDANAADLEFLIRGLKEQQRADTGNSKWYARAIDNLESKQQKLLGDIGQPDAYKDARKTWQEYHRDFSGKDYGIKDKTGLTGGKAVSNQLSTGDKRNITKNLLGGNIDSNLAEQVGKHFIPTEKHNLIMDHLRDGIDVKDLENMNSTDTAIKLISNFNKANPQGMRLMLGDKGYESLKDTIGALTFTQEAISRLGKEKDGIGRHVLNLAGAAAAAKISPYAATHVAINESRNIVNKLLKDKNELIKRVKNEATGENRAKLLRALNMISSSLVTDNTSETTELNANDSLPMNTTNDKHISNQGIKKLQLAQPSKGKGIQSLKDNNTSNPSVGMNLFFRR